MIGMIRPAQGIFCTTERASGIRMTTDEKFNCASSVSCFKGRTLEFHDSLEGKCVPVPLRNTVECRRPTSGEIARLKLALVGLAGFEGVLSSEISGGMCANGRPRPRHGVGPGNPVLRRTVRRTRPISSRNLDQLILELRDSLGATVVSRHPQSWPASLPSRTIHLPRADTKPCSYAGDPNIQSSDRRSATFDPRQIPSTRPAPTASRAGQKTNPTPDGIFIVAGLASASSRSRRVRIRQSVHDEGKADLLFRVLK